MNSVYSLLGTTHEVLKAVGLDVGAARDWCGGNCDRLNKVWQDVAMIALTYKLWSLMLQCLLLRLQHQALRL
ncbi:MAG: hypothetical protein PUP90_07785 [Nostoc sp. S4]|nr:hypothetical protein [Nostoc sp. S4]